MQLVDTVSAMHRVSADWRAAGERICLVPTMGNLHAGHLRLVERAQALGSRVVVSIFVNPLQFGPSEDYAAYPRTVDADRMRLQTQAVDALFMPSVPEIYPRPLDRMTRVEVPEVSDILCGATRPGHFTGVATVVCKLFNIVGPHVAVFGEKDFQQLFIIRRLVADLGLPIDIEGVPTEREADGLAMSSRNAYLSAEERRRAPELYRVLTALRAALAAGDDFEPLHEQGLARLRRAGFEPEYLELRRAADLAPVRRHEGDTVLFAAARLGSARLIDNVQLGPGD